MILDTMHRLPAPWVRRLLLLACAVLAAGLLRPAAAAPLLTSYAGSGNVAVFDAGAGTGGWVGSVDGFVQPGDGQPLPLVSVVLFELDPLSRVLSGRFEFTSALDLSSTLFGQIEGSVDRADILTNGGQFAVDYRIEGASGVFAGISGFGLSFVDFDPAATGADNYREAGLFVTDQAVPSPATGWLALAGLLALAGRARRGASAGVMP